MSKKLTTDIFIQRAKLKHGDTYNYSKSIYQKYDSNITIICKIHGEFIQSPSNHLAGKGCIHCGGHVHLNNEEQIERFNKIHSNAYSYENTVFTNYQCQLSVYCLKHGSFKVNYSRHIIGAGCPQCTGHYHHRAGEFFEQRARKIHGSKYQYGEYKTAATIKMNIICPIHGLFKQFPSSHLQGHGCKKCSNDRKKLLAKGGYSEEFFTIHPEMKLHKGTFYLLEFKRKSERFIKIGITRTNIASRFKNGYKKYSFTPLIERHSSLYDAFTLEKQILEKFKSFQVFPKQHNFVGKTECLSPSCLDQIKQFISN